MSIRFNIYSAYYYVEGLDWRKGMVDMLISYANNIQGDRVLWTYDFIMNIFQSLCFFF